MLIWHQIFQQLYDGCLGLIYLCISFYIRYIPLLVEYCVRFIALLAFKGWWRNHLLSTKWPINYYTWQAFTFSHYVVMLFHFVILDFVITNQFLQIFVATESCYQFTLKLFLNALLIDKMFQCLRTTLLIFGREQLHVNTSRVFVSFKVVLSLSFKNLFMSIFSTTSVCWIINSGL